MLQFKKIAIALLLSPSFSVGEKALRGPNPSIDHDQNDHNMTDMKTRKLQAKGTKGQPTSSPTLPPSSRPPTRPPTMPPSRPPINSPTPSPTTRPSVRTGFAYAVFMGRGCNNRNELDILEQPSVRACAALCDANPACVSFEYMNEGRRCQLSSTCRLKQTEEAANTNAFNLYLKVDKSFPYTVFMGKGCINRNELGITEQPTVRACAALCDADPTCVSFEYMNEGNRCQLSSSCRLGQTVESSNTDAFNWYLKANTVDSFPYAY